MGNELTVVESLIWETILVLFTRKLSNSNINLGMNDKRGNANL